MSVSEETNEQELWAMKKTFLVPHGVVFFCDESHPDAEVPFHDDGGPVAANRSCVSVITMHEVDGETSIEFASEIDVGEDKGLQLVFEGQLETPGRLVSMSTSQEDRVMEVPVSGATATLTVWLSDLRWPERVLVQAR